MFDGVAAYAVVAHPISAASAEPAAGHPSTAGVLTAVTLLIVMTLTARAVFTVAVPTHLVTVRTAVGRAVMAIIIAPVGRPAATRLGQRRPLPER
jgi:hypothetical protein